MPLIGFGTVTVVALAFYVRSQNVWNKRAAGVAWFGYGLWEVTNLPW